MTNYEILYIIRGNIDKETAVQVKDKVNATLKNASDLKEDFWGMKELAYEIKKVHTGYYVVLNFNADIADINEMERQAKINKDIIRFMVINKAKEKGAK